MQVLPLAGADSRIMRIRLGAWHLPGLPLILMVTSWSLWSRWDSWCRVVERVVDVQVPLVMKDARCRESARIIGHV